MVWQIYFNKAFFVRHYFTYFAAKNLKNHYLEPNNINH